MGVGVGSSWPRIVSIPQTPVLGRLLEEASVLPFVDSELAFEDLGSWEVKKYTYKYLRDGTLDGRRCVENRFRTGLTEQDFGQNKLTSAY